MLILVCNKSSICSSFNNNSLLLKSIFNFLISAKLIFSSQSLQSSQSSQSWLLRSWKLNEFKSFGLNNDPFNNDCNIIFEVISFFLVFNCVNFSSCAFNVTLFVLHCSYSLLMLFDVSNAIVWDLITNSFNSLISQVIASRFVNLLFNKLLLVVIWFWILLLIYFITLLLSSLILFIISLIDALNSSILLFCNSIFCAIFLSTICNFSSYKELVLIVPLLEETRPSIFSSINLDNISSSVNSLINISNSFIFISWICNICNGVNDWVCSRGISFWTCWTGLATFVEAIFGASVTSFVARLLRADAKADVDIFTLY